MGKKVEYKREVHKVSDATTPLDIEFETVREDYKLTVQHISVEDEDSDFTGIKIGYKTEMNIYHWWVEEDGPKAGRLYWMHETEVLTEGMVLIIRFVGTTNLDNLQVYVDGFETKMRDP